jgi:hypothetical protein
LDNQATAIADRIHSSMTSIRKLPNIPTLGDILLSFVQVPIQGICAVNLYASEPWTCFHP